MAKSFKAILEHRSSGSRFGPRQLLKIFAVIILSALALIVVTIPQQTPIQKQVVELAGQGSVRSMQIAALLSGDGAMRISESYSLLVEVDGIGQIFSRNLTMLGPTVLGNQSLTGKFHRYTMSFDGGNKFIDIPFKEVRDVPETLSAIPEGGAGLLVGGEQMVGVEYEIEGLVQQQGIEKFIIWDIFGSPLYVPIESLSIQVGMPRGVAKGDVIVQSLLLDPSDTEALAKFMAGEGTFSSLTAQMNSSQEAEMNYQFVLSTAAPISPPKKLLIRVSWLAAH